MSADGVRPPRAASIDEIERDLADVERFAERVLDGYRWLFSSGFGRSVRSTGASGSDPAALTVSAQHAAVRAQLGHASKKVRHAAKELYAASNALDRALAIVDRRPPAAEPLEEATATHADVRRAEAAQARRGDRLRRHVTPWAQEEVTG